MPFAPHTRIQMSGTIGPELDPYEIFTMTLSHGQSTLAGTKQERDDVVGMISGWFGRPTTQISNHVRLREVSFAEIGANGKQIGETARVPVFIIGGSGQVNMPPQVAIRVSLSTGLRGRSQRGGFYVPVPTCQPSAITGQISEGDQGQLLNSCVTLINDVNRITLGNLVVASGVTGNGDVRQVRIGRRLDTIRRRANAISEGYATQVVDPAVN